MVLHDGRGTTRGMTAKAVAVGACAVGMAVALTAWAQEPAPAAPPQGEQAAAVAASHMITPLENDRRIARWLNIDNRMIIEAAKHAQAKASNPEVKQFAEALAAEHEKCRAALEAVRQDGGEPRRTTVGDATPDRSRTAVTVQDDGARRDGRLIFRPTDFLSVKESVARHVGQFAKKEWDAVTGVEYDRAFMKHIVMAHECLLSTVKEVRGTASAELRAALDAEVEKLKGHAESAKALCDRVCKDKPAGTQDK